MPRVRTSVDGGCTTGSRQTSVGVSRCPRIGAMLYNSQHGTIREGHPRSAYRGPWLLCGRMVRLGTGLRRACLAALLAVLAQVALPALDLPVTGSLAAHLQQIQALPQAVVATGGLQVSGEPTRTEVSSGATLQSDCSVVCSEVWTTFYGEDQPFEAVASQTGVGKACRCWAPVPETK